MTNNGLLPEALREEYIRLYEEAERKRNEEKLRSVLEHVVNKYRENLNNIKIGTVVLLKDVYGPVRVKDILPHNAEFNCEGVNRKGHTIFFNLEDIDEVL